MEALWRPWSGPGLEHLRLTRRGAQNVADSLVIVVDAGRVYRVAYDVRCDARWRVRELRVSSTTADAATTRWLEADGQGHWHDASGAALPALDGCVDVHLAFSPFTNTLPIRRLALTPGDAAKLAVVYLALPDLTPTPDGQRYTCLRN